MHRQLKYLLLINSFSVSAVNLLGPFFALYLQGINASITDIGRVSAWYVIVMGSFTYLLSRFENKKVSAGYFFIIGFLLRALGWTGYMFATDISHFYIIQAVIAISDAFGAPAYNLLYSTYLDKGKYASEWGLSISINALIMAISVYGGSVIVEYLGFTALFAIMVVFSLISAALALRYRKSF